MSIQSSEKFGGIGNVLFALSPLTPSLLNHQSCIDAAMILKQQGAIRADLTIDPRLINKRTEHHARINAVPEFTRAAHGLSEIVFRPVIGQSDVHDLKWAESIETNSRRPDLQSLTVIAGSLVNSYAAQGRIKNAHAGTNGRELGLIFYLALHGQTPDLKSYDKLVAPDIAKVTLNALCLFNRAAICADMKQYGWVIDLAACRDTIMAVQTYKHVPPNKILN